MSKRKRNSEIVDKDDEFWRVKRICARKWDRRTQQYLYEIEWENWDGKNTWEPATNIYKPFLEEYEANIVIKNNHSKKPLKSQTKDAAKPGDEDSGFDEDESSSSNNSGDAAMEQDDDSSSNIPQIPVCIEYNHEWAQSEPQTIRINYQS